MEKKKLILTGVAIMALIGVVLGATYAYFVAQTGKGANANVNVQAGTTDSLRFEVTNNLNIYASLENFAEGKDNLQKSTDLKAILKPNNNTNEARYNYYVYLDISKNELEYTTEDNKPELLLKVTKPDGTELTTIEGLVYKSVVNNKGIETSGFDITTKKELITIASGYEIYANGSEITQDWNVEIILVNLGSDQNGNTNKHFMAEAKIQSEKKKLFAMLKRPSQVIYDRFGDFLGYKFDLYNEEYVDIMINRLVFEDGAIIHTDADYVYDFSEIQDNSIQAYVKENDNNGYYTIYINSNKKVVANEDMGYWISAVNSAQSGSGLAYEVYLESIEGLEYVDFSNTTNMKSMFMFCNNLKELDLNSLNTSKVTDMSNMFEGTSSLMTLDLSSFDTSQVTDMLGMFSGASSLTTLDLSNFNTSNVTNMSYMFHGASSLTTLDLSNFDTSNVTNMRYMFSGASSLTTLDLSNFNTYKVTTMYNMFFNCASLITLDLSSFDTSQVTDMSSMFEGASSLTELDISNMTFDSINLSNTWNYSNMFSGVPNNIHIKVKDEAARAFIQARLDEDGITEGVIEVVNK